MTDDALRDYLMQDLALAKLRLKESQRHMNRVLFLLGVVILFFTVCIGGFITTVFIISRDHTEQIKALCAAGIETTTTIEKDRTYQENVSGNAIMNNNNRSDGNYNTANQ